MTCCDCISLFPSHITVYKVALYFLVSIGTSGDQGCSLQNKTRHNIQPASAYKYILYIMYYIWGFTIGFPFVEFLEIMPPVEQCGQPPDVS